MASSAIKLREKMASTAIKREKIRRDKKKEREFHRRRKNFMHGCQC